MPNTAVFLLTMLILHLRVCRWGAVAVFVETKFGPKRARLRPAHDGRLKGEIPMENSTKDQAEGKFHEMKGKVKEKVGQVTNNPNLKSEGQGENLSGKS